MDQKTFTQQLEVAGDRLVDEVKKLYEDASARRVVLKDADGHEIFALPLTWGIGAGAVAVLAATPLAAVAAVGGILAKVKLEVERIDQPADATTPAEQPTYPENQQPGNPDANVWNNPS